MDQTWIAWLGGLIGYSDHEIDDALYHRCLALNRRGITPSDDLERMLPKED